MPPASVDPGRLRSLGAALGPLRECAGEGAEEVLAQFPELGDREAQGALDGWVEQLADLLREVDATASDLAGRLRVAALNAPATPAPHEPQALPVPQAPGDPTTRTNASEGSGEVSR